jgi:hypothetical protein
VPRLRFGQDDVRLELRGSKVRLADYLGATRKASNPSSIHVELGIVNLHSSELNFLP